MTLYENITVKLLFHTMSMFRGSMTLWPSFCEDEHRAEEPCRRRVPLKNGVQNLICFKHLDISPETKNHVKELRYKCRYYFRQLIIPAKIFPTSYQHNWSRKNKYYSWLFNFPNRITMDVWLRPIFSAIYLMLFPHDEASVGIGRLCASIAYGRSDVWRNTLA